jgi:hypothetical protein
MMRRRNEKFSWLVPPNESPSSPRAFGRHDRARDQASAQAPDFEAAAG